VSVDVWPKIFFARRTSPVEGTEPDERCDDYELHPQDGFLRQLSKEVRPIVQQGKNNSEQQRCSYGD
jgi:hypothetical protein